jgi:hypothetical protein
MTPTEVRNIRCVKWDDFARAVTESEYRLSLDIHSGDAFILKGAFPEEFMRMVADRAVTWAKTRPSSFHKMLDGVPDFHRVIDEETGKLYSIQAVKHSFYFFRWNADPLGIWPEITKRWRVLKQAMGMKPDEYEGNKPSDGPTDRIQVVKYPSILGYLEPHRDTGAHQPCFISGYMSKRGKDYQGGGFYFVKSGKPVFAEDMIDIGDVCIGHANLLHGVAPTQSGERWFLGLYSNASDYEAKRNTSKPERIEIEGVRP